MPKKGVPMGEYSGGEVLSAPQPNIITKLKRKIAIGTAASLGFIGLGLAVPVAVSGEPNPSADPACADYMSLHAGHGAPERQDWFNHLDAPAYARYESACVYSWDGRQFDCLYRLWGPLESSWNQYADNPHSNAYGIPQANPGSKMGQFGPDWPNNPRTQVNWGLDYVSGTGHDKFHNPCQALDYRLAHGSY
jgi:hypothetical protein